MREDVEVKKMWKTGRRKMWKSRRCGRREDVEVEKIWKMRSCVKTRSCGRREDVDDDAGEDVGKGRRGKEKKGVGDIVYIGENKASDLGDLVSKSTRRVVGVGRSFLGRVAGTFNVETEHCRDGPLLPNSRSNRKAVPLVAQERTTQEKIVKDDDCFCSSVPSKRRCLEYPSKYMARST